MPAYSADSPIVGIGTVSASMIDRWVASLGPKYIAYAPDKTYKPAPPLGDSVVGYARLWGINAEIVAAQLVLESAAWQSAIARDKNNPAGLGAENDDPSGKAVKFDTPDLGIRAQVAHLADYALGKGDWTAYDPRASAMPAASFGVATSLSGLDGRWATPGRGYGASIAALANDLIAFAQQTGGTPVVDISGFTPPKIVDQWFPVNGVSYLGEAMQMRGVCVHQTGNTDPGAEAQQNVAYMNSPECIQRQASWHDTVGLNVIIRTIPHDKQAYHASDGDGPGNTHYAAVEHVVCYPVGSAEYRRVMLNGAWYLAKSLRDARLQPGVDTLKQHHDFARDGKDCPAQFRDNDQWPEYVAYVQAFYDQIATSEGQSTSQPTEVVPGVASPPAMPQTVPDPWKSPRRPGTWIPKPFADAIKPDWMRAGYVVSEAFIEGNLIVQYFERARLELDARQNVTWGLVGWEAMLAKHPERATP